MKAPASKSGTARGRGSTRAALGIFCLLWLCCLSGAQALAQAGMPGRVLTSTHGHGGIIALNPNATNVVHLSANTFHNTCANEGTNQSMYPSATRDGRLVAFMSSRDGTGFRIFVMNADGTSVRQLTTGAGAALPNGTLAHDESPVISPDGSRVAFVSQRNSADPNSFIRSLFVVNADGTGLRQVTFPQSDTNGCNSGSCPSNGNIFSAVWSPDGTWLTFKGVRLAADNSGVSPNFHQVAGLVNADGTGEATLAVLDSTEDIGG